MYLNDLQRTGRMPLVLDGWSKASVWGFDPQTDGLFAQLWRDGDSSREAPRVWITAGSMWPATDSPRELAEYVAAATGCTREAAAAAMAYCAPAPVKEMLAA